MDDEYSYDYQQTEGEEYIYKEAVFESLGPTAPSREMLLTDGLVPGWGCCGDTVGCRWGCGLEC